MAQYIDKDTLVAEIEKWEKMYKTCPTRNSYEDALKEGRLIGYKDTLHKINTLEVKEVDLEKELSYDDYMEFFEKYPNFPDDWGYDEARIFANYFFKLGLKTQKGK